MKLATRFNYNSRSTEGGALMATGRLLTENDLRSYTPSVFAETAHESRSHRYTYIPTIDVVRGLADNGFSPVFACEAKARDESKFGYTKHMIRFRQENAVGVRGSVAELVLINSHDGSTRYQLIAGVFRSICANGMVCGESFTQLNIRHSGKVIDEVVNGAFEIAGTFSEVLGEIENFGNKQLSEPQQIAYAKAALALKYYDPEKDIVSSPIQPETLLVPKRYEDRGNDVYSTFNRVQEHLVRGGDRGVTTNNRRTTTRPINGIDGNVKLNRGLWTLTQELAKVA